MRLSGREVRVFVSSFCIGLSGFIAAAQLGVGRRWHGGDSGSGIGRAGGCAVDEVAVQVTDRLVHHAVQTSSTSTAGLLVLFAGLSGVTIRQQIEKSDGFVNTIFEIKLRAAPCSGARLFA